MIPDEAQNISSGGDLSALGAPGIEGAQASVAIIGMVCRFPGAENVEDFWANLQEGKEGVEFLSESDLAGAAVPQEIWARKDYVRAFSGIKDIDLFAASFFNYSPREAEFMDPQQRIFLEGAWHALEAAGYSAEDYEGRIGVFAGCGANHYAQRLDRSLAPADDMARFQAMVGNEKDFLSSRVAYKLNLKGPAVTVQTACSTSLVAVHLACQSILSGDSDLALAGGISLPHLKREGYLHEKGMVFSPDGHCRAFDEKAEGTMAAGGMGIVVLKSLPAALADGDNIWAVIIGSAINNDGSQKVGYSAPSVEGQYQVIADALTVAGVNPGSIGYVEAHGTGTPLGDPIEIAALTRAYRQYTPNKGYAAIGSLKTNVGHLDAAAGVAGLIKVALAVKHGKIPPHLHFEKANPKLNLDESPFYVSKQLKDWAADARPRRAGVSSFGIGGTNAHVIVEEAPPTGEPQDAKERPAIMVLSAKTPTALEDMTENLAQSLGREAGPCLADVAYTLQVGRKAHPYRRAVVARGLRDAHTLLRDRNPERLLTGIAEETTRSVVFMFSGHGGEHPGMGVELYKGEPTFSKHVDACAEALRPLLGVDIRGILYPEDGQTGAAAEMFGQNSFTQAMLFTFEYALAQLWMSWGVRPSCMIGHSSGEYVAACVGGVLSLEDALALAVTRGRLIEKYARGRMLVAFMSERDARRHATGDISLAAINSPTCCVFSGSGESVEALQKRLAGRDVETRLLETPYAGHSSLMDRVAPLLVGQVAQAQLSPPAIPYVSNVTGDWITAEQATDPKYWGQHTRETVRFGAGIQRIINDGQRIFLEIGPGRSLAGFAYEHARSVEKCLVLSSLPSARTGGDSLQSVYDGLARLWIAGVRADWRLFNRHSARRRVVLPTYPFERERYWVEVEEAQPSAPRLARRKKTDGVAGAEPEVKEPVSNWFYEPRWTKISGVPDAGGRSDGGVLVFLNDLPFGEHLVETLRESFGSVIAVRIGPEFAALSDHSFTIKPDRPRDYEQLIAHLASLGRLPHTILHAWNVTEGKLEEVDHLQTRGLFSLVYLAQAIGGQTLSQEFRIIALSDGLYPITGEEVLVPEKATLLGPCRVIPKEYANIDCLSLDIIVPKNRGEQKALAKVVALLTPQKFPPSGSVALRDSAMYEQTFAPLPLPEGAHPPTLLRRRGVYLITGGLGGIGLVIAKYLAQACRAGLVLVGRAELPERESWAQWREAFGDSDPISIKLAGIEELEAAGAGVEVVAADVASEADMARVAEVARKRFGRMDGIIHAAGVASGGVVQRKSVGQIEKVLRPKLYGTLLLERLFGQERLDFFLLCSSVTGILGDAGQVDHCAANAYLDAFARSRGDSPTRLIAIDWDTWSEVGGAVRAAATGGDVEALQQHVRSRKVNHPWFDLCRERGDGEEFSFVTFLEKGARRLCYNTGVEGPMLLESVFLELVLAACGEAFGEVPAELREVKFLAALRSDATVVLRTVLAETELGVKFTVSSRQINSETNWSEHVEGLVAPRSGPQASSAINRSPVPTTQPGPAQSGTRDTRRGGVTQEMLAMGITSAEGIEVLERVFTYPKAQIAVSTTSLLDRFCATDRKTEPEAHEGAKKFDQLYSRTGLTTQYVGPRDPLEIRISEILGRFLGIERVGLHDNFFELGGNSLGAIRIVNVLSSEFEIDLSAATLIEYPTVAKLASLVSSGRNHSPADPLGTDAKDHDLLVRLKDGDGTLEPVFLIHPAGGTTICYRALADCIGGARAVYGIQAVGLTGKARPLSELRAISRRYIQAVRRFYPKGVVHLGGASFGGAVALEMAQQLNSAGERAGMVFMIDTPGPKQISRAKSDIEIFAYLLGLEIDFHLPSEILQTLSDDEKLKLFLENGQNHHTLADMSVEQLHRIWQICKANAEALRGYEPRSYSGSVVFFSALERDEFTPHDPASAWAKFPEQGLKVHRVPGNHISMLERPHVEQMARILNSYLETGPV